MSDTLRVESVGAVSQARPGCTRTIGAVQRGESGGVVSRGKLVCKLTIGSLQRGESSKLGALIVTLDDEGDYQQFSQNVFFTKLTCKTSHARNISKVSDYLILTN